MKFHLVLSCDPPCAVKLHFNWPQFAISRDSKTGWFFELMSVS